MSDRHSRDARFEAGDAVHTTLKKDFCDSTPFRSVKKMAAPDEEGQTLQVV